MVSKQDQLNSIIEVLQELSEDSTVPKNIKSKVVTVMNILKSDEKDLSLKISKAMHELEEISDDNNLQAFTRTQIWNITSMLEKINS